MCKLTETKFTNQEFSLLVAFLFNKFLPTIFKRKKQIKNLRKVLVEGAYWDLTMTSG